MMNTLVTRKDERYDELFQVEKDVKAFGVGVIPDPYPAWRKLLAAGEVHQGSLPELMGYAPETAGHFHRRGFPCYTAFSYAAVSEGYTNSDRFSAEIFVDMGAHQNVGDTINGMEGERHRRYRDWVQPFFQPAFAAEWWGEKVIVGLVDELISSFEKKGTADLNADFFARLPMHTVTAGFGLSPEEGLAFRTHFQVGLTPSVAAAERASNMNAAVDILRRVIEARQKDPKDDVISKMAHGALKQEDGSTRKPTTQEILDLCRLTVAAGGGTTWRQLGITLFALLNNPEQLDALKANRKLLPNAILESVRWHTTDPMLPRKVVKDTTLQGVPLPKDATVHLCIGAANRDPSRWENADQFDIHRPVQRSVAFGAGPHSCLGQHVARQEILVAMNAIFDRLPNIRWDPSKPAPQMLDALIASGPGPLHVVFG